LNLFEGDVELENELQDPVELVDSILALSPAASSPKGVANFDFSLRFRKPGTTQQDLVAGVLSYELSSSRFRLSGRDLNSTLTATENGKGDGVGLAKYLNQDDESFAVAFNPPDVFYTSQAFYRIDYTHAEARLSEMLRPRADLGNTTSEKGSSGMQKTGWDSGSIFHIIDSLAASGLMRSEFPDAEFVYCDDMGTEIADFVCANFDVHRIAFIHAKHGANHHVSASALHEAISQAIKNLSVLSSASAKPHHINRWNRDSRWPGTNIKRWRKGPGSLPERETLWNKIRTEILDHPAGQKEVWLVLGRTLDKDALLEQLTNVNQRNAVTGQVVHLLSSLLAQCTQLAVRLKVFCH